MEVNGNCFTENCIITSRMKPQILKKCFNILQNIEIRSTLQKHLKRLRDPIAMSTINMKPKEPQYEVPKLPCGNNNAVDILQMGLHSK